MKILVNEKKVERAKEALKKSGLPITDEAVEALYKTYGGLVIEKTEEEIAKEDAEIEEEIKAEVRKKRKYVK